MKKRFTFLIMTAFMLLAGMSALRAQAPDAGTVLWSENWDNGVADSIPSAYLASENNSTVVYGDAEITYASTINGTKLVNEKLAGGTAPELLLKSGDTWTITGIPSGGADLMTISYKSNNTKASVSSPTEGVTVTANTSKAATYTCTIKNDGNETFDLVFSASGNTRLDDIELTVAPKYTLAVAAGILNGTIELSATSAAAGETITITSTPEEDYTLATLFYTDGETVTDIDIIGKQFVMPAADITVGATFAALPDSYFKEVKENLTDWSGDYILAYQKNIDNIIALSGYYSSNSYGTVTNIAEYLYAESVIADNATTRSMMLTIAATDNGYSINLKNVGYLGLTSDGNYLDIAETVVDNQYEWTINYDNDTLRIANANLPERLLQCNATANPNRYACYKGTQKYPSLYKYNGEIVEQEYSITIADGIENGTVEASAETATEGTEITITAEPADGYELATLTYVYGDNEPIDIKDTKKFDMPAADVTVNATFSLIPTVEYTITIADGIENGTVEASAETAVEGTEITVTATPAEGYLLETLTYVYGDEEPIDIKAGKNFEMPAADVTINATFAELLPPEAGDILWSESWDNGLADSIPASYLASENHSTVVYGEAELTYTSTNYSTTTTKLYNETLAGGTAPELLVAKTRGSFTANGIPTGGVEAMLLTYKANNANLSLSTTTEGITITAKENKAAATYTYVISNEGNTTFDLTFSNSKSGNTRLDDILLVVKGPDPTYTLSVAEGIENGEISLSAEEATEGTEITVTVEPAEGYMIETLNYTYGDVETIFDIDQETLTFEMPAGDVVVNATFKLIPTTEYNITIADGIIGGTVTPSQETAIEDTPITVGVTTDEGYILESLTYVYGDEEPIDITAEKAFVMPAADVTINATFAALPEAYFAPVTENLEDWTGDYLMAYRVNENTLMALRGYKAGITFGDTINVIEYLDGNGLIAIDNLTLGIRISIEPSENGYTLKHHNGGYLGWLTGNSMVFADSVENSNYEWTLNYENDTMKILNAADPTRIIRYNVSSPRFATYNITGSLKTSPTLYRYNGPEIIFNVYVDEDIMNGSVTVSPEQATDGEIITVTATPAEGYKLESLSYTYGDAIAEIDTTTKTFVMPLSDVEVSATFKAIPTTEYNITVADGIVGGTITPSQETAVEDTPITIEAVADEGYILESVTYVYGDEEPIDITAEKSFIMPAADVTINATFAELPEAYFAPVTENTEDWSGQYLMAYRMDEDKLFALNRITKVGSNNVGDTLNIIEYLDNNGLIEANGTTTAIRIEIEPSENGYTLNLNNNGYLGWISGNTLVAADSITPNYEWTLTYANDTMKILNVADNDRMIKFNTGVPRFAAYSMTSSVQTSVTLYKYYGPEIVDETYTLTVAETENGNIELSAYEATAGSTITVTATPNEGFVLEGLTYTYDETTTDIDLATMSFTMPAADVTVSATFVGEAAIPAITNEILPIYIQGKDGTNNNRLPYAYRVTISNLTPEATYRYVNQVVTADDNANYDGVGNMIFASCEGDFVRTTSGNLTDEGNYGEFTTDEDGEYTGWFITEATANNRFTPGNHVYMRIRINDGNDGTTAAYKLTTSDYATVINFGTENEATQGTAIVGKTQENDKNFVFLFAGEDQRPVYGTTIENTGVDYASVSQYASFYQNQVSGNSGFWGGIIPNVNDNGIRFVGMYDNCTGEATAILEDSEENGVWDGISTANPTGGISNVIFIDFTTLGVKETESGVTIWNRTNEIVVDMNENNSYRMTVYNLLGQPVMSRDINGAGSHTISHKLASGMYIINLSNSGNNFSTKIVVK